MSSRPAPAGTRREHQPSRSTVKDLVDALRTKTTQSAASMTIRKPLAVVHADSYLAAHGESRRVDIGEIIVEGQS